MVSSVDLCPMYCGGKDIKINNKIISDKDLVILTEKDRLLYFSMIESNVTNPKVALVGLCPGYNQVSKLVELYNLGKGFNEARFNSSFSKANTNISKMLRKIGVDKYLGYGLSDEFDYNNSGDFFTTSLVKCASLKLGKGRSDEFDPLKFDFSRKCIANRFVRDILSKSSLKKIIFFGKKAQKVVCEFIVDGKTIKEILQLAGKEVIFIPHPSGSNNGGVAKFLRS